MCCRGPDWEAHPRIFLPENADLGKAGKLRAMGALVAAHGSDAIETEEHARQEAQSLHGSYISPYNDPEVSPDFTSFLGLDQCMPALPAAADHTTGSCCRSCRRQAQA